MPNPSIILTIFCQHYPSGRYPNFLHCPICSSLSDPNILHQLLGYDTLTLTGGMSIVKIVCVSKELCCLLQSRCNGQYKTARSYQPSVGLIVRVTCDDLESSSTPFVSQVMSPPGPCGDLTSGSAAAPRNGGGELLTFRSTSGLYCPPALTVVYCLAWGPHGRGSIGMVGKTSERSGKHRHPAEYQKT
jgi:hypothetical protein